MMAADNPLKYVSGKQPLNRLNAMLVISDGHGITSNLSDRQIIDLLILK